MFPSGFQTIHTCNKLCCSLDFNLYQVLKGKEGNRDEIFFFNDFVLKSKCLLLAWHAYCHYLGEKKAKLTFFCTLAC